MVSLHEKFVTEIGVNGREQEIAALGPSRVQAVEYVHYRPPPVDGTDKASVEEWLERARFIEEDLHALLKLPHDRFWCQIIFDVKLHHFIDSYLREAPRPYDRVANLPPSRTLPSEISQLQETLHRLFFFVCLRASTHHESATDFIDASVYGEILYENYVFDVARLMDICAIYGCGCETLQLVKKMIENVFTRQPKYRDDLKAVVPHILQILSIVGNKCGVHVDAGSSSTEQYPPVQTSHTQSPLEKMPVAEFEDIILYVSDVAFTLRAFLDVYPAAAPIFWETDRFPVYLASAYESLSTAFRSAFRRRVWIDHEQRSFLKKQFHRVQVCFLRVFRLVVYNSCLRPVLERRASGDSVSRLIESYLDVMYAILSEKHFLAHLHTLFPFSADSSILHGSDYLVDDVRLKYIQDAFDDAVKKYVKHGTKRGSADVVESCAAEGLAETAGGEYRDLDGNTSGEFEGADVDEVAGACASEVSDAQIESMISSVKDLLPNLGSGFVRLCLEEYNYDVERVINAVLEDRLLPSLQDVDRSLAFVPSKSSRPPASFDQQSSLEQRRNIFDGDAFDVFSRDDIDTSRIHKGKRVAPDKKQSDVTPEIRKRIAAYAYRPVDVDDQNNAGDLEGLWEYDDEYDDTYDSNVIGADDVDSADELLSRRAFVTPRVLAGARGAGGDDEDEDDDEDPPQLKGPSVDAGAAPPRDAFVEDPAKIRQLREQRMAARQQQYHQRQSGRRHGAPDRPTSTEKPHGDHDVKGGPRGQGQSAEVLRNRAYKEKNKATRVHHNRKDLADRKRKV